MTMKTTMMKTMTTTITVLKHFSMTLFPMTCLVHTAPLSCAAHQQNCYINSNPTTTNVDNLSRLIYVGTLHNHKNSINDEHGGHTIFNDQHYSHTEMLTGTCDIPDCYNAPVRNSLAVGCCHSHFCSNHQSPPFHDCPKSEDVCSGYSSFCPPKI